MTTLGTFTALPSLRMVEAAEDAYHQVLTEAQARGADAIGSHLAMSAALTAARVTAPAMTLDEAGELAARITASTDPRVVLIDALRAAGVEVVSALEPVGQAA